MPALWYICSTIKDSSGRVAGPPGPVLRSADRVRAGQRAERVADDAGGELQDVTDKTAARALLTAHADRDACSACTRGYKPPSRRVSSPPGANGRAVQALSCNEIVACKA